MCRNNKGGRLCQWNDGPGYFGDSEQSPGNTRTRYLYLADLDRDGDLDAFIGSDKQGRICKKKRHPQKAQVMTNQRTQEIIATAFGQGSTHDFRLFQ